MDTPTPSLGDGLQPTPADRRIEALDVVRGFALIGICLMNLDFFNRSVLNVGGGMPAGLAGIDRAAAFFTQYFVTGKFWTMFSLLFGMGFAVMLGRAQAAGRSFFGPYLRRIAALAVFGALHHIFIWGGDILFSYAVGAVFLLLTLYGNWKLYVGMIVLLAGAAFIPGAGQWAGPAAFSVAVSGLAALYLRGEKRWAGMRIVALLCLAAGTLATLAAGALWLTGAGPAEARLPLLLVGVELLAAGWLARRDVAPASRPWRLGAAMWVIMFSLVTGIGAARYYASPASPTPVVQAGKAVDGKAVAGKAVDGKAVNGKAADGKAATREAERAKRLKERAERIDTDARTMQAGIYAETVALRASHFATRPVKEVGFALILIAVFLIGTWFIRSGVMADTAAHLPLFRRLAFIGIPVGVGLGLLGSLFATTGVPGVNDEAWQLASGLLMLGNLPASIGYASALVLMLHSRSALLARVRALAPFGRMALTNYILQSLVCATVFYGYGFGLWGMGRAAQLVFALGLCAVLLALSHWWLARFRYGPLEWVWRAVTYLKLPAMRVGRVPAGALPQPH